MHHIQEPYCIQITCKCDQCNGPGKNNGWSIIIWIEFMTYIRRVYCIWFLHAYNHDNSHYLFIATIIWIKRVVEKQWWTYELRHWSDMMMLNTINHAWYITFDSSYTYMIWNNNNSKWMYLIYPFSFYERNINRNPSPYTVLK